MQVTGIHHIELNVSDLEASFNFYAKLASFFTESSIRREGKSFSWNFKSFYFYFNQVQERFADVAYHRKRTGLDHIAIRIETKDQIMALREFFLSENIRILHDANYYGEQYFAIYIEDPDRIKLEFGAQV